MKRLIFLIPFLFLINTSCSNYVSKMHAELDREQAALDKKRKKKPDTFAQFRKKRPRRMDRRRRNSFKRPDYRVSTANQSNVMPSIKRQYRPESYVKRRYKASDLTDNQHDGSLWSGQGNDNYLFTQNKKKRNGDIILINVYKKLKSEITMELARSTPKPPAPKKDDAKKDATAAAPEKPKEETTSGKVKDRISSVIIEEINKDHILLRGQKYLLYKNRKRLVEVQALVARRDISDDDAVNSDNILESSVHVIR